MEPDFDLGIDYATFISLDTDDLLDSELYNVMDSFDRANTKDELAKKKERFTDAPLSENDLDKNIDKQFPTKTKSQNTWALNAWKDCSEWRNSQPQVYIITLLLLLLVLLLPL